MKGLIDWRIVEQASRRGELHLVLSCIPPELWGEKDPRTFSMTFVSYACSFDGNAKAAAMLMNRGLQLPWNTARGDVLRLVLSKNRALNQRVLRYNLRYIDLEERHGDHQQERSIAYIRYVENVRIAIANGAHLRGLLPKVRRCSAQWKGFEKAIARCRSTVVALLKVKDLGELHRWDRFLLAHVALQVWLTREDWEQ